MFKAIHVTLPVMALLAGAAIAPAPAHAEESHTYSAQSCNGYSATDRTSSSLLYYAVGVRNTGSATRELSCPMNLDSADPITAPVIDYKWMWAWVNDRSTSAGFNCQPAVKDNTGAFWYGYTSTTGAGTTSGSDQALVWLNPFNSGNPFPNMVIMSTMRCYLPGSSSDLISINSTLE